MQNEILKQANLIIEKHVLFRIEAFEYAKEYSSKSFDKDTMKQLFRLFHVSLKEMSSK